MREDLRALGRVARDPRLRRLQLGYAGFALAEYATWLAILVYAFEQGGVGAAGLVAVVQLVPAMLVAPFAAFASDRFRRDRVLAAGYAIQALTMGATALAMGLGAPEPAVYAAAVLVAMSITFTRPALRSLLPSATHVPSDLTAANVVVGMVENVGMFAGPAVAGVVIAISGPTAVFASMAVVVGGAAALVGFSGVHASALAEPGTVVFGTVIHEALEGLRTLRRHRNVRLVVFLIFIAGLVIGASDVLFVTAAEEVTDRGEGAAGVFGAAFGLGAMVGSALTVGLVGRARMTPYLAIGVVLMAVPLLVLAAAEGVLVVALLFTVMGAGETTVKVTGSTMIQRIAPDAVLGRLFGTVEGLNMGALAAGSALISVLVSQLGFSAGLVVAGLAVPLLALTRLPALLGVDRGAVPPDARIVELLVHDEILGALPAPAIERLAVGAERRHVGAGDVVIHQGDIGDRYYVVEQGQVHVAVDGRSIRDIGPGRGFGEIALLHAVPRTATVTATTDVTLVGIARDEFLETVTGHPRSLANAHDTARRLLES